MPRSIEETPAALGPATIQGPVLALLYCLASWLGLSNAVIVGDVAPLWPATGVGIAGILILGRRAWIWVFVGALAGQLFADHGPLASLLITTGSTLEAATASAVITWADRRGGVGDGLNRVGGFVLGTSLGAMLSASLGLCALIGAEGIPLELWSDIAWTWCVSNMLGGLILAPALLSFSEAGSSSSRMDGPWRLETGLALAALVLISVVLGTSQAGAGPWLLAIGSLLLWSSARLDQRTHQVFVLLAAALGVYFTGRGLGPFSSADKNESLVQVQTALAVLALIVMLNRAVANRRGGIAARLVLVFGIAFSWFLHDAIEDKAERLDATHLQSLVLEGQGHVEAQRDLYVEALRSGAALLHSSDRVTRSEWRQYVETLAIVERHAGLRGLGMILPIDRDDITELEEAEAEQGALDFKVHAVPAIEQRPQTDEAFPIVYIEPVELNGPAVGLDLASESMRYQAASSSRRNGQPRASGKIILVQDQMKRPGFLIYLPVYDKAAPIETDEQRLDAHICWVYSPLVSEEFFSGAFGGWRPSGREIEPVVMLTDDSSNDVVFMAGEQADDQAFAAWSEFDFLGHDFKIGWRRTALFPASGASRSRWIGAAMAFLSILLAGLVASLQLTGERAKTMADELTRDLQSSEARFQAAVEATPSGMIMVDRQGRIVLLNREIERLFGYQRDELLGQPIEKLVPESSSELHPTKVAGYFAGPTSRSMSQAPAIQGRRRDGSRFPVEIGLNPIHLDEGTFVMAAVVDVSNRVESNRRLRSALESQKDANTEMNRLMEEANAANSAKSTFLANMSHEIRTPMNAVLGMGELLKDTELSEDQREYVRIFTTAGESLLQLINGILDLAKVESDKVELESVAFDLQDLVRSVADVMRVPAARKGLDLAVAVDPDLPPSILGDPLRLRQILINLIGNGVKFTEQGRINIDVYRGEGSRVVFAVEDTGIGIAKEDLGKLFQPFSQVEASTARRFGGTGLGLALCDRFVRLMGSTIEIDSEVGRGTRFSFEITLKRAAVVAHRDPEATSSSSVLGPSRGLPRRILLVDDTRDNRFLINAFLAKTGITIEEAQNGEEAISRFREGGFDVVLMDMQMPVMDGYEATHEIRAWESAQGLDRTPIIALTADAMIEDRQRATEVGCDGHVAKPISRPALLDALADFGPQLP